MTTVNGPGQHVWTGRATFDGEGDWRCGCGAMCDHEKPCSRHGTCDGSHRLSLTPYERDNLLHALVAASGYGKAPSPLYVLNTGDWLMQVLYKLGFRHDNQMQWGSPNTPHDVLATNANARARAGEL